MGCCLRRSCLRGIPIEARRCPSQPSGRTAYRCRINSPCQPRSFNRSPAAPAIESLVIRQAASMKSIVKSGLGRLQRCGRHQCQHPRWPQQPSYGGSPRPARQQVLQGRDAPYRPRRAWTARPGRTRCPTTRTGASSGPRSARAGPGLSRSRDTTAGPGARRRRGCRLRPRRPRQRPETAT